MVHLSSGPGPIARELEGTSPPLLVVMAALKMAWRLSSSLRSPYDIVILRVQVPNNHILTQNLYYNYYYPKPKYLIIGYMDPLGNIPIEYPGNPYRSFNLERQPATS